MNQHIYECEGGCREWMALPYWRTFGKRLWCELCRRERVWRPTRPIHNPERD